MKRLNFSLVLGLFLILSLSFVSAGWFGDLFNKKFTGESIFDVVGNFENIKIESDKSFFGKFFKNKKKLKEHKKKFVEENYSLEIIKFSNNQKIEEFEIQIKNLDLKSKKNKEILNNSKQDLENANEIEFTQNYFRNSNNNYILTQKIIDDNINFTNSINPLNKGLSLFSKKVKKVEMNSDISIKDYFLFISEDIIFDCKGYELKGYGENGIIIQGNAIIKNCIVNNRTKGGFYLGENGKCINCTALNNGDFGFYLEGDAFVEDSSSSENEIGFVFTHDSHGKNLISFNNSQGFLTYLDDYFSRTFFGPVIENSKAFNNYVGFYLTDVAKVSNSLSFNNFFGFRINDRSSVFNVSAFNNFHGVILWGVNNSIENSKAYENKGYGFCLIGNSSGKFLTSNNNLWAGFLLLGDISYNFNNAISKFSYPELYSAYASFNSQGFFVGSNLEGNNNYKLENLCAINNFNYSGFYFISPLKFEKDKEIGLFCDNGKDYDIFYNNSYFSNNSFKEGISGGIFYADNLNNKSYFKNTTIRPCSQGLHLLPPLSITHVSNNIPVSIVVDNSSKIIKSSNFSKQESVSKQFSNFHNFPKISSFK